MNKILMGSAGTLILGQTAVIGFLLAGGGGNVEFAITPTSVSFSSASNHPSMCGHCWSFTDERQWELDEDCQKVCLWGEQ